MSERIPTVNRSSNDDKAALVASYVVPPTQGAGALKLMTLLVYLDLTAGAGTFYLQLHNAATLPANATRPTFPPTPLAAGQYESIELGAHGIDWDNLTVALSTTAQTLTIAGAYLNVFAVLLG